MFTTPTNEAIAPLDSPVDNAALAVPYRIIEDEVPVNRIHWCSDPEQLATLLRENPALTSIRSGGAIYLICEQSSMLKPELHSRLQPAFALLSVGALTIGFGLSALSISFTKADNFFARWNWNRKRAANILEHTNRIWMATIEGVGAIFPSLLTEIIIIYCSNPSHWNDQDQCMVSDETFSRNFLPGPLLVALIYTGWNSIPFQLKEAWTKKNKCILTTIYSIDISLNALLYSRYIQAFSQVLGLIIDQVSLVTKITKTPHLAITEIPAIVGALSALILQTLKPRSKQIVATTMTYFFSLMLLLKLTSDIYIEYDHKVEPDGASSLPWAIIKTIGFGVGILGGSILTALWNRTFVKEWIKVKQYVPVSSAYILQRQIRDEVRDEIRQKIIAELQQEDAQLENAEQAQQIPDNTPNNIGFVFDNMSTRLVLSRTQLEQASNSSDNSPAVSEQGRTMITAYRQQVAPALPSSDSKLSEVKAKPKSSLCNSLFSKCSIM